ncbi:tautomerase family protein [Rhizobium tubonense]|uniref:tautomerase family protein n=1 Tax=Rhizobium tubonense TaxID=484088 RepID=UPI003B832005
MGDARCPVKAHVLKGPSHDVVVEYFGVPQSDRYQILQEHEPSHFRAVDTGLEIERTEKFALLQSPAFVTLVVLRTAMLRELPGYPPTASDPAQGA